MSDEDQVAYDEVFEAMIRVDQSLDEVIESVRAAGVKVADEQRGVVSDWLDLDNEGVPMGAQLQRLSEMLRGAPARPYPPAHLRRFMWGR